MATKLKNLKITKVDFVDEGANPDAHIMLAKRKDGAAGESVVAEAREEAPKGFFKRLFELFNQYADELLPPEDGEVAKGGASTFDTELNRGKAMDELWDMHYALADSICSIICDAELDNAAKQTAMEQSVEEFASTIKEAIKSWTAGQPSGFVAKTDGENVNPLVVATMKSMADRLSESITKSTQPAGESPDTTTTKEGDNDMKFDKSKMTPAERAMLEQFEKNYGVDDAPAGAETTVQTPGTDVEKSAAATAAQTVAQVAEPAAAGGDTAGDVFKNLDPAVKAKIEALEKFKQDAEDAALHEVAKRYAIIGKKDEDLFPVLKSLKASSQQAYDSMIAALDSAKEAVEKSGAFAEIGKSGTGSTTPGGAVKEAEQKAAELMKSKSGLTFAQAVDEVLMADADLAKRYEKEE